MKLSEAINNIKKVINTESDLTVEQIVIKEKSFHIQMNSKWYNIDDYENLIQNL
jgi:hypothetical protein